MDGISFSKVMKKENERDKKMKNKIFLALLCLAISCSTVACSSSSDKELDLSKLSEEEREKLLEELQEKDEEEDDDEKEDDKKEEVEQETWDDDYIIGFANKSLLAEMQDIVGVTSRDITYGDVKKIKEFDFLWDAREYNIENFKYFTGLERLEIHLSGNNKDLDFLRNNKDLKELIVINDDVGEHDECNCEGSCHTDEGTDLDIEGLWNLTNLENLQIEVGFRIKDVSGISNLTNLENLDIRVMDNINVSEIFQLESLKELSIFGNVDISGISNLTNLESLDIYNCHKFTDVNALSKLSNLRGLGIYNCDKFTDVNALGKLPNLSGLSIWYCDNFTDISKLTNLTGLDIRYCDNFTDTNVLGKLPNLKFLNIWGCDAIEDVSFSSDDEMTSNDDSYDSDDSGDEITSNDDSYDSDDSYENDDWDDSDNVQGEMIWEEETWGVKVNAPDGYVNFRTGPGTNYSIITPINNGVELEVYETDSSGKWLKVYHNNQFGWVSKSQVSEL